MQRCGSEPAPGVKPGLRDVKVCAPSLPQAALLGEKGRRGQRGGREEGRETRSLESLGRWRGGGLRGADSGDRRL